MNAPKGWDEIERARFETHLSTARNHDASYLKRDPQHLDYYLNRIIQAAWEGWAARSRLHAEQPEQDVNGA